MSRTTLSYRHNINFLPSSKIDLMRLASYLHSVADSPKKPKIESEMTPQKFCHIDEVLGTVAIVV